MSAELINPQLARIFRIVHIDNVRRVLRKGCHSRSTQKAASSYVEIGNQELIERRRDRSVPCGPGGTLSDYVPFYFTPYSPMLYNIKTGYGVPQQPMKDIVILASSLPRLAEEGVPFVFSDRHAYLKTARFSDDLDDLDQIIWPVLQARDFRRDDVDKFEKYQAEALVYKHVPVDALDFIACYDRTVRDKLRAFAKDGDIDVAILAKNSWYL